MRVVRGSVSPMGSILTWPTEIAQMRHLLYMITIHYRFTCIQCLSARDSSVPRPTRHYATAPSAKYFTPKAFITETPRNQATFE